MRNIVIAFAIVILSAVSGYTQDSDKNHESHAVFYPASSFNLFGGVYNTTTDQWHWYVGAKTMFIHPAKYVWVGGVGFGVAFAQEGRGSTPVLTLVPIKIGALALEFSPYKIETVDPYYYYKYNKGRLMMISWNWNFNVW